MSKREKTIPDHIHAEPKEKPQLVPDIQASKQRCGDQSKPQ